MGYDHERAAQLKAAREYMTPEDREFLATHSFEARSGDTKAQHRQAYANQAAKTDIEKRAMDVMLQTVGARKTAERATQAAEAKAAADRAEAIRYAALSPMDRAAEDFHRELVARSAVAPTTPPTTKIDRQPTRGEYMPSSTNPTTDADALSAIAKELSARAEAEPTEGNKYQALVAGAEAAKARARVAFEAEVKAADLAVAERVARAGDDPVARARAKADATSARALGLGQAESAFEAASLDYDRAVVDTAKACKLAEHRIESRKAAMKADEAKAENDPQRMGNPFWKPPVSLADWQFAALDPATQRQAIEQGVKVYSDPAPAFSAAAALNVLRSRGSVDRKVVTRAELAELSPADQMKAARGAIITDD